MFGRVGWIAALRSDRLPTVQSDDQVVVLRLLVKRHRDMARLRNKHCSRLHALLLELEAGGIRVKISVSNASRLLDSIDVGVALWGSIPIMTNTMPSLAIDETEVGTPDSGR